MAEPPSSPVGVPNSNAPAPDTALLAPNIAAVLACLFSIFSGIVFLVLEKRDKFVRFWAVQSVFLGGIAFAVSALVWVARVVFGFIPVFGSVLVWVINLAQGAFGLALVAVYVVCLVKAFSNQEWEIPWLGKLARKQLALMDGTPAPPAT